MFYQICKSLQKQFNHIYYITVIIILAWAAITNYLRLGGLNNKYLFLTVLDVGKSKIKEPAEPVSGEGPPFLVYRWPCSFWVLMWWKEGSIILCLPPTRH